jgi:hypothetical protein
MSKGTIRARDFKIMSTNIIKDKVI